MITLAEVRDFMKSFKLFDGYYIGRIDADKSNILGVYSLESKDRHKCIGNAQKYDIEPISLLVHGSTNKNTTEILANTLYERLDSIICDDSMKIGGKKVYIVDLQQDKPVDVDAGENKIYEYVIEVVFYVER